MLSLVVSALPAGAVPPLMNYQGYLTNAGGTASTGTFPMTFALYADSTGGSAMWTETYAGVSVNSGVFAVLLGQAMPLPWGSLLTGNMLWLESTVNGNVLRPRRPIVSVPYAFRAAVADSAASTGIRTLGRWAGAMPDGTDNGVLVGRSVSMTKKYADTGIRVGWSENFRVFGANTACRWEILFNGSPCGYPITFDKYETSSSYSHDPVGVFGTCFGLPAGPVFITTRVGPPPGFPATDCYTGWQGLSSIEAEEVR